MAQILAGASASITIPAGQVLRIEPQGDGQAVLGPGPGAGTAYNLGESLVTIGPFTWDRPVYVTANAAITYTLVDPGSVALTMTAAQASAGLVGWVGTTQENAALRANAGRASRLGLTTVGNSLVAGSNTNSGQSFAAQLQTRGPELFRLITNAGVSGRKSADVLANLAAEVPAGTRWLMYHEGTNDGAIVSPVSVSQHAANVRAVCNWAIARGIMPIVVAAAPVDVGGTFSVPAGAPALIEQYSFAERLLCEELGAIFVDPWSPWCDPADGTWNSAANVTDGEHPPQAVHDAVAAEIIAQIRLGRPLNLMPRSNAGPAGFSGSNVLNLTGSGLPTGWLTSGVAPSASAVSSASAPVRGQWADQTITGLTAQGDVYRAVYNAGANFSQGDRLRLAGYFKFTNSSNMRLSARLLLTRSSGGNASLYLFDTDGSFSETYFNAEIVVPDLVTNAQLFIRHQSVSGGSSAYTGAYSFACFDVYNVTRYLA